MSNRSGDISDVRYIAIEGPIGVGKTSLANLLSRELKARLILEKVEENPFLRDFYKDPKKYAFQAQIFFLLSRYRQQVELAQEDLFSRVTISDYFFPKDRIFAYLNLDEKELSLYEQIYSLLNTELPRPDLVIYLQASTEALLQRIRSRGREYERGLLKEYLEELNNSYNSFFFNYTNSPLLVIDTTGIDFVKNRADMEDLLTHIKARHKGTCYYLPLNSRERDQFLSTDR